MKKTFVAMCLVASMASFVGLKNIKNINPEQSEQKILAGTFYLMGAPEAIGNGVYGVAGGTGVGITAAGVWIGSGVLFASGVGAVAGL